MTKYICKYCNYETDNQSNFLKHKKTSKHIKLSNKSIVESISTVESISIVESNITEIKKLIEMINKQNEIIEKQNKKIEILENKVELLIQEKTEKKESIKDNEQIMEPIKDNKDILEEFINVIEEEEQKIRVDEKTLAERKKERKQREMKLIDEETKRENKNKKNKEKKIIITDNLIANFQPINPPIEYMKKAIIFICKLFKEQNINIVDEFDETINSTEEEDIDNNYNIIQNLLMDNQDFFKDGCCLLY